MSAKETTLNELGEMMSYVVENMATKEDIAQLDARIDKVDSRIDNIDSRLDKVDARLVKLDDRIANIERELSSIRRDLDMLAERVENITGYRKEIDHALERMAAIEKNLGIKRAAA